MSESRDVAGQEGGCRALPGERITAVLFMKFVYEISGKL
jgi:hypothetical protein